MTKRSTTEERKRWREYVAALRAECCGINAATEAADAIGRLLDELEAAEQEAIEAALREGKYGE